MAEAFLLTITGVFQRGALVTGRVAQGTVRGGDKVEIAASGGVRQGLVVRVESFDSVLDAGNVGDDVGLVLSGAISEGARPGEVITSASARRGARSASAPARPKEPERMSAASALTSHSGSEASTRDQQFIHAESEYRRLRERLDRRQITPAELDEALAKLMFRHRGRHWMIGANTGRWYMSDADRWVEAEPPKAERAGR